MITFAYDGTLNGDWVAHYATRFAANEPDRRLRLLHVREEAAASTAIERLIAAIGAECALLGVALEPEVHSADDKGIAARLLELAPIGPDALLVCGTRARPRNFAFLEGTVSQRLLQAGRRRRPSSSVVSRCWASSASQIRCARRSPTPSLAAARRVPG